MRKKQHEKAEQSRLGITPMAVPLFGWFLFVFGSSVVFVLLRHFFR